MRTPCYLSIILFAAASAWPQAVPEAMGVPPNTDDEYRMPTPPLVNAEQFPVQTRLESRSNYLHAGLTITPAYVDNVLVGFGSNPVADMAYTVTPTLSFDKTIPRLHFRWRFDPGFTVFQRVTARNDFYQNTALHGQYRLTQHMTISWVDTFQHTANAFGQPYEFSAGAISGMSSPSPSDVAPLFAERLFNQANAGLTYQPTMNGMIGVDGSSTWFDFPDPSQARGLCNSDSRSASGFYSRRVSGTQYLGLNYQYTRVLEYPQGSEMAVYTHGVIPFYMTNLGKALTVSIAGGMQYYHEAQNSLLTNGSWTPMLVGSFGWQSRRTSLALQGSRSVTGGGGLLGTFLTTNGTALVRWLPARSWAFQLSAAYFIRQNVSSLPLFGNPGGHSISGTPSIERALSEHITVSLGYEREHMSYGYIESIARNPDLNRASISISYQFSRALGR